MIVGFTGHRPDKCGGYKLPNKTYCKICQEIEKNLLKINPKYCISGMALGVDSWAAFVCIKNNIPFKAAIPFEGQENLWTQQDKSRYYTLLSKAKEKVLVSNGDFSQEKMQIRNEYIVNNSDILIAVFDGSFGGTFNTVNYAKKLNKEILIINPN